MKGKKKRVMWCHSYSWGYSHVLWTVCPQMLGVSLISSLCWVHWGYRNRCLYCVWKVTSTLYIGPQLVGLLFCFHYSGFKYKSIEHQSINMFPCSPMHRAGSVLSIEGNTWKIGPKLPCFTFSNSSIVWEEVTESISPLLFYMSKLKKVCSVSTWCVRWG